MQVMAFRVGFGSYYIINFSFLFFPLLSYTLISRVDILLIINWLMKNPKGNSEKAMAIHSSTLAWKIPWTEEPGRLQSMGLQRVRHDCVTSLSLFILCIGEGNGNPLQYSCLENPRDGGAWWAAVYGVEQSQTRLKQLSSSSSSKEFIRIKN